MITLAIDTSAHLCAAALHDDTGDAVMAEITEDIGRGHAERLMDVIGDVLRKGAADYSSLGRVAACAGPGSFTGVRVGLATARGIALGLGVPAIGVSALEALRHEAAGDPAFEADASLLVLLDARRGEAYAQFFGPVAVGLPGEPFVAGYAAIAAMAARAGRLCLCGSGAPRLIEAAGQADSLSRAPILHTLGAAPIACYARLGAAAPVPADRPEPLYLRPPDAKPQTGFAIARA